MRVRKRGQRSSHRNLVSTCVLIPGARISRYGLPDVVAFLKTTGAEEPQPITQDWSPQSRLIDFIEHVRLILSECSFCGPGLIGEAVAEAPLELVAAGLGDGADHSAGEMTVLRRDRTGQNRSFLNSV